MERLKKILARCKCNVLINVNDHRNMYESVEEHMQGREEDVDPEVLAEMIRRDSVVWLQFYPDTPIGFYVVYHYDVDMALDEAMRILEGI